MKTEKLRALGACQEVRAFARLPLADYVIGEGPTRVGEIINARLKMKENK